MADGRPPLLLSGGPRLLVVLHGHGDDPAVLVDRRDELDPDHAWTVVAPTGPVTLPDGGRAWFDDGSAADAARLLDAMRAALAAGQDEVGDVPPVVLGWSQGGAAALGLATWPGGPTLAGAAAIAGWLPSFDGVVWAPRAGLPTLLVHGEDDEVVPLPLGRSAARHLERSGVAVEWSTHPVGHELGPAAMGDVAGWLARQLPG